MSKKTKIVVGFVLLVLVILIVKSNGPGSLKNDTIRVGIIAPLTGPAAAYGVEARNTVVLALDQINEAGGIKGKRIEYFIEDGKCEATTAVSAWNKLVTIDRVQAVFGGACSTESVTIAPLSAGSGVPVFAVFATAPKIQNEGEWFFRHISTNDYYATVLAREAYKKGYRNVALITEQKEFPASYSDKFIVEFEKLGGKIALDDRFISDTKDFRAIALKLKGVQNDAVFVSVQAPQTLATVAVQIKDLGLEKPMLFNHTFSYAKYIEGSKGYMPKDFLVVQPYTNIDSPKGKVFTDAYKAKYGDLYKFNSFFMAADYDIVNRFKDAANVCMPEGSLDIDCVRNEFKTATSYSGVAGDVRISSEYSPHSVISPVSTVKIVDGKEVLIPIE